MTYYLLLSRHTITAPLEFYAVFDNLDDAWLTQQQDHVYWDGGITVHDFHTDDAPTIKAHVADLNRRHLSVLRATLANLENQL